MGVLRGLFFYPFGKPSLLGMAQRLYTIGYEGATVEDVVSTLKKAGVGLLIDVRAVPLSRKPGFSKNKLAGRLAEADIRYLGLKALGTPAEGRAAARRGNISLMESLFAQHMDTEPALVALGDAVRAAQQTPSCLLCFEHEPRCCHRLLLSEYMQQKAEFQTIHLNPVIRSLL